MRNVIRLFYKKCHNFLADHKGLALFLSHGGLHLLVLVILIAISVIMVNKLNRLDNANTEIFKFELGNGGIGNTVKGYELQNLKAEFEFYRGEDYMNGEKFSRIYFDILTAYRPRIRRDSLLKNTNLLKHICNEDFQASISVQSLPSPRYPGVMFYDTAVYFQKQDDKKIIFNPYREERDSVKYELSGRVDKVQLFQYEDYSYKHKGKDVRWINYACDRKRTYDTDYIKVSDSFSYGKPLESPYFSVYIRFSERGAYSNFVETDTSYISYGANYIKLSFPSRFSSIYLSPRILHPIAFKTIQPTPSKIGLDYIIYEDVDVINEIINGGGIYISAEDVDGARKVTKLSFIYSVLLGTIIAFMLDILIQLILKWRKLGRNDSKRGNENLL